eukprot:9485369-Pyramimonas_sp.AAC.3
MAVALCLVVNGGFSGFVKLSTLRVQHQPIQKRCPGELRPSGKRGGHPATQCGRNCHIPQEGEDGGGIVVVGRARTRRASKEEKEEKEDNEEKEGKEGKDEKNEEGEEEGEEEKEEEREEEEEKEDEDQQNSQKHLECLSDVSWKPFGSLFGRLGGLLAVKGASWTSWVLRGGCSWGRLGSSWGVPGGLLAASWGLLGASWGHLGSLVGPPGRLLGPYWRRSVKKGGFLNSRPLGSAQHHIFCPSRGALGTLLGALGAVLGWGSRGPLSGPSWAILEPS